jgi:hypothetical protein
VADIRYLQPGCLIDGHGDHAYMIKNRSKSSRIAFLKQMAEPDKSKISEIRSRLSELEAEKKRLLQELKSETIPAVPKEKYGTPAVPAPVATSKERIALFTKLFCCREDVSPKIR